MVDFRKVDELHDTGDAEACYKQLKALHDSDANAKRDIEFLWRMTRACHLQASFLSHKDSKRKTYLLEGQKFGNAALALDAGHFEALKWTATCVGSLTDLVGTKERIQLGKHFKDLLDRALAVRTEYSLLHMRGRYSYSVAMLSWMERKVASAFFDTPPTATVDEALRDFLEVERARPNTWIENLLYIAKCYIAKNDRDNVVKYLRAAAAVEVQDEADREGHDEAKSLLSKWAK